jgi:periplasmic divalent cation tolerance protein
MTDYVQVSTETRQRAIGLAGTAVKARLAAGGQVIGPVTSIFWHLGEYGTGEEWKVLLATTAARYPELEKRLLEHHPWDNPELTAVPFVAGAERCLHWIGESVTTEDGS